MGLIRYLRKHPETLTLVQTGVALLGPILGGRRGDRAALLAGILGRVPGRQEYLAAGIQTLGDAAEEHGLEAGDSWEDLAGDPPDVDLEETVTITIKRGELDALDDWIDLQSQATKSLRRRFRELLR